MVFAGIDHIVVGLVIRHATNIHLEAVYARAIAHPMSKARGLRSRLVKKQIVAGVEPPLSPVALSAEIGSELDQLAGRGKGFHGCLLDKINGSG
jgi:hypothetical protein